MSGAAPAESQKADASSSAAPAAAPPRPAPLINASSIHGHGAETPRAFDIKDRSEAEIKASMQQREDEMAKWAQELRASNTEEYSFMAYGSRYEIMKGKDMPSEFNVKITSGGKV